jgi:hypothetical protein
VVVVVPDGGSSTLTGTLAFPTVANRVFAHVHADGGPDFAHLLIALTSVEYSCAHPMNPLPEPGMALALEANNATGGPAKGTFLSTGSEAYLVEQGDGGFPTSIPLEGQFTLDFGADPTQGVTGTADLRSADGGTLQVVFEANYCGAF